MQCTVDQKTLQIMIFWDACVMGKRRGEFTVRNDRVNLQCGTMIYKLGEQMRRGLDRCRTRCDCCWVDDVRYKVRGMILKFRPGTG